MGNNPLRLVDPTGGVAGEGDDCCPSQPVFYYRDQLPADYTVVINEEAGTIWFSSDDQSEYFRDSDDEIWGTEYLLSDLNSIKRPTLPTWDNVQQGGILFLNSGVSGGGFGGQGNSVEALMDFSLVAAGNGGGNVLQRISHLINSSSALGDVGNMIKEYFGWGKGPNQIPTATPEIAAPNKNDVQFFQEIRNKEVFWNFETGGTISVFDSLFSGPYGDTAVEFSTRQRSGGF